MNWREALEAQIDGIDICEKLLDGRASSNYQITGDTMNLRDSWQTDSMILQVSTPYAWSAEVMKACLHASHSIPDDCVFSLDELRLHLETPFWYFEAPLPFDPTARGGENVVAIAIAHLGKFSGNPDYFSLHMFTRGVGRHRIAPSQIASFYTGKTKTFAELREDATHAHDEVYATGPHRDFYKTTEERLSARARYVDVHIGVLKFVAAGLAWIGQKIVLETEGDAERHRRKEFKRKTFCEAPKIKVVHLRKALTTEKSDLVDPLEQHDDTKKRMFTCQWVVEGHWRNQVCGPNRENRRLQFIMPYVKGPDDKPLRTYEKKVMVVDR